MKKKTCIITSTRADYSFYKPLIDQIRKSDKIELQIIATGTHLEEKYGRTVDEMISDGNVPDLCVSIINDDTKIGIIKTMSDSVSKVGEAISKLCPDMIILIGDRYEIFAAAASCVILGIPIAHISGGDVTYGAFDDMFRHCITKMSYIHFTSCEEYRNRVIQLGESPDRVFSVGSLSIESINQTAFLSQDELEKELGFSLDNTLLATFHPTTLEGDLQSKQFEEFLLAIEEQKDYKFLFTEPNADTDREVLALMLKDFARKSPQKIKVVGSLGSLKYLTAMKYCAGVIGNSSSGILEAPSFAKGTINIGNRQKGRICAESVINCDAKKDAILQSLKILSSSAFQKKISMVKNPYEQKDTSIKIVKKIEEVIMKKIEPKRFFDLKFFQ